jgi:hypothetical protein
MQVAAKNAVLDTIAANAADTHRLPDSGIPKESVPDGVEALKARAERDKAAVTAREAVAHSDVTRIEKASFLRAGETVSKIYSDGLLIESLGRNGAGWTGARKVSFEQLPESVQRSYGYDPQKAAEYLSEQPPRTKPKTQTPRVPRLAGSQIQSGGATLYIGEGSGHWIESVMDDGSVIKLEDDSLWQVSPFDVIDSALWLPISDITVIEGNDPGYPYKLVNTDDGEVVNARLVSQ